MQRKKNIRLLVLLSVLVIVTILLYSVGDERKGTDIATRKFAIADTSSITRVLISGNQQEIELSRESGKWTVNDKFLLDEGMRTVLLSVLNRVRIQRPVAATLQEEVVDSLQQNGYRVQVFSDDRVLLQYLAGGDKEANVTYFKKNDESIPYVVHLPGYESYVAGLFEITENDWRNRILLATDWNMIDSLKMTWPGDSGNNFSIIFKNQEYSVPEVPEADTSVLYSFMDNVSYVIADRFIDQGQFPRYDSLSKTTPLAMLSVNEIGDTSSTKVNFYPPLRGERMLLGKTGEQLVLFDFERIRNTLVRREALQP
jgi:hypothetical protein